MKIEKYAEGFYALDDGDPKVVLTGSAFSNIGSYEEFCQMCVQTMVMANKFVDERNMGQRIFRQRTPLERRRAAFDKKKGKFRKILIDRDGEWCQKCGAIYDLCIDHIVPLSMGGSDTIENLRLLCRSCNSKKGVKYDI